MTETIDIKLLKTKIDLLFHDLLAHNPSGQIVLDKDYYWNIPQSQLFDVYKEVKDITVGQLTEDLNELVAHESPISNDFVKAGILLRFIAWTENGKW